LWADSTVVPMVARWAVNLAEKLVFRWVGPRVVQRAATKVVSSAPPMAENSAAEMAASWAVHLAALKVARWAANWGSRRVVHSADWLAASMVASWAGN